VQRIVPVDREVIIEKEISKAVIIPTKDSESIKTELAHALLIEKLVVELQRITKDSSNVKLQLDKDVELIFFTELNNKPGFKAGGGNFSEGLTKYTTSSMEKLGSLGGNWAHDH
jgi:hypothetical protein